MNLRPQRKNANKHSEHGLRLLEKSLQQDGWIDAQTIAADGEMISGSARLEVAGEKFADVEPIIVESDGTRPVIVKRTDIPNADDPRARRLSVAANQIAHTDWNPDGDLLKEWGNEDKDIRAMFADSEWAEVTGDERPTKDAEPQTDRAAELLEKWQVKTGDLWQIGEHRLICGDCTDAAVVERVMGGEKAEIVFTDPPFPNNSRIMEEMVSVVVFAFSVARSICKGVMFWFWDNITEPPFPERVNARHVWHKTNGWQAGHWEAINEYRGDDSRLESWVYSFPNVGNVLPRQEVGEHPTPKPVGLIETILNKISGNIIVDFFGGSGTTLVACENLKRRGRAVEISPAYCAVTLERMFTAFPGIEIKRLE